MRRLLWIGNPFFVHSLSACGWETVWTRNFRELELFSWEKLVDLAGFEPDVLVVGDKSMAPFVLGMEDFPCLTVFYAIDSHLHSWFPLYAQGFDVCLVSLYDHRPWFIGRYLPEDRVLWSPPFAQDNLTPSAEPVGKKWDCIFVGSVSAATPKRRQFLDDLARGPLPGLHVVSGNYAVLFPESRVVLNYCEHGDLNFRVFEALGMGSALVTPRIANRQDDLFRDGEHLLLYDPEQVADAYEKIRRLLEDEALRRRLEEQGCALVNERHRARHRAEAFTREIARIWPDRERIIRTRRRQAGTIRNEFLRFLYLLWAREDMGDTFREAYLRASKGQFR